MNIEQISQMIEDLVTDTSIPKNIRKSLAEAKARLDSTEEDNVKISAAIYLIEGISEDINMPSHARTQIWAILGSLESF